MMNQTLLEELKQYIAENWEEEIFLLDEKEPPHPFLKPKPHMLFGAYAKQSIQKNEVQLEANTCESEIPMELDESFSEMLLRKIDESGKKTLRYINWQMSANRFFPTSAAVIIMFLRRPQPWLLQ